MDLDLSASTLPVIPGSLPLGIERSEAKTGEVDSGLTAATRLDFLDGLRGLLSFWVLAGHTAFASGVLLPVINHTIVAVDIFMFISGFLMAYHFRLREAREPWEAGTTWIQFYVRRFFRIAPAYYVILLLALVFREPLQRSLYAIITAYPPEWANVVSTSPEAPPLDWGNVFSHFTFLFGFIPKYASSSVLPDWSIGLEMQFYLALPFIMLGFRRLGYFWATALCVICWILSHQMFGVYPGSPPKLFGVFPQPTFLPLKLNCFVVGILIAEALHWRKLNLGKSVPLLLGAFIVATLGKEWYFLVACLASCVFLFPAGSDFEPKLLTATHRFLQTKFVTFVADTSYGVYLIHNLVLLPIAAIFLTKPMYQHLPASIRFALLLAIVIAVTYPLTYAIHRLVETPGIALGRRVGRSLSSKLSLARAKA